jgi:hypothetical protein
LLFLLVWPMGTTLFQIDVLPLKRNILQSISRLS